MVCSYTRSAGARGLYSWTFWAPGTWYTRSLSYLPCIAIMVRHTRRKFSIMFDENRRSLHVASSSCWPQPRRSRRLLPGFSHRLFRPRMSTSTLTFHSTSSSLSTPQSTFIFLLSSMSQSPASSSSSRLPLHVLWSCHTIIHCRHHPGLSLTSQALLVPIRCLFIRQYHVRFQLGTSSLVRNVSSDGNNRYTFFYSKRTVGALGKRFGWFLDALLVGRNLRLVIPLLWDVSIPPPGI